MLGTTLTFCLAQIRNQRFVYVCVRGPFGLPKNLLDISPPFELPILDYLGLYLGQPPSSKKLKIFFRKFFFRNISYVSYLENDEERYSDLASICIGRYTNRFLPFLEHVSKCILDQYRDARVGLNTLVPPSMSFFRILFRNILSNIQDSKIFHFE